MRHNSLMDPQTADRRLRVLWLIKGLGPGGAEQLLLSSARVADHETFDYRVGYLRADKTHLVSALKAAGVRSQLLGGGGLRGLVRMRRLMRGVDVVHAHSPVLGVLVRVLALTVPRASRPAVVYTEHNEWGSYRLPTRLANALTAPLDDRRWAVSEPVRASMWPSRRRETEVLVHGIVLGEAPQGVRDEVRAELEVPKDAVVGLTVANFRREKDYPNLLAAARLALNAEPRLVLLAVGQGPLAEEVHALHESLGLGERFRLLGYRDDVPRLLGAVDFFLLGSAHEGLPVAVMEALAAGLPVVATAVGGIPEAVETGIHGIVVPAKDPSALAEAIIGVVRDDERRQAMGEAAQERSRVFDIRTAVAEEEQLYLELAPTPAGVIGC